MMDIPSIFRLFNYVDEEQLSQGTYGLFQTLRSYFTPELGVPDNCGLGTACYNAQENFLTAVQNSQPMQTVQNFLASKGNHFIL